MVSAVSLSLGLFHSMSNLSHFLLYHCTAFYIFSDTCVSPFGAVARVQYLVDRRSCVYVALYYRRRFHANKEGVEGYYMFSGRKRWGVHFLTLLSST